MINNETLLHKPMPINLGWLDDEIALQGMSEGAPYPTWVADTGSTAEEMQDHVDAFRRNIAKLQKATVRHGGFYWQVSGLDQMPRSSDESLCALEPEPPDDHGAGTVDPAEGCWHISPEAAVQRDAG